MIGTIYIRSLIGIIGIVTMMCYLNAVDSITEALLAIGVVVYIDNKISGKESIRGEDDD